MLRTHIKIEFFLFVIALGSQTVTENCTLSFAGVRLVLCYAGPQCKQSHFGEQKYSSQLNQTTVQVPHGAHSEFILKSAGKFEQHAIENVCDVLCTSFPRTLVKMMLFYVILARHSIFVLKQTAFSTFSSSSFG